MAIYLHPSPGEGSNTVHLKHWSIREFENGTRVLVGFSQETRDGRVSTAIVELDSVARRARTASGRIYHLVGSSGWSSDSEYTFNRVVEIIGEGGAWRDVTTELIPDCRARNPELSLEATARVLFVSRSYVRRLIDDGKLSARTGGDGLPRIPLESVMAFREQMRIGQREGLENMMDSSERAGLYDAETDDLPVRRKSDNDTVE